MQLAAAKAWTEGILLRSRFALLCSEHPEGELPLDEAAEHHPRDGKRQRQGCGKQWVHLYKTNVKCRATIENIVLWEAELLTKEEMELLALEADPNFKPKTSKDVSASAAGVWRAA